MSALAKPFIKSTKTSVTVVPVNIEEIVSYTALDVPTAGAGGSDIIAIVFTYNAAGGQLQKDFKWVYATTILRNEDLASIDLLVANTLV